MKYLTRLCLAAAITIPVFSAGCTTVTVAKNELPMSFMNHCAAPAGVTVNFGTLTIALGERPTAGYGIDVVGQQQSDDQYEFIYQERRPAPGMMQAQVITEPCMQVILPPHWQQVVVINQDNGQRWQLTPADDRQQHAGRKTPPGVTPAP